MGCFCEKLSERLGLAQLGHKLTTLHEAGEAAVSAGRKAADPLPINNCATKSACESVSGGHAIARLLAADVRR